MTTASSPPASRRCVSAGYLIASDGPQTAVDGLRYITERPASPSSAGPAGPPLAQQVPALVESGLGRGQLPVLFVGGYLTGRELGAQLVLGLNEIVDVRQDLLVIHGLHRIAGRTSGCHRWTGSSDGSHASSY